MCRDSHPQHFTWWNDAILHTDEALENLFVSFLMGLRSGFCEAPFLLLLTTCW